MQITTEKPLLILPCDGTGELPEPAPQYEIHEDPRQRTVTGYGGTLKVKQPEQLAAAIEDWRGRWAGYEPRIRVDSKDPCLAHWSRWNTCE
jgi:hypothetical protein